jgi:hypothetical protein
MSLGRAFGTNLTNIPSKIPYVKADPERIAVWKKKLEPYEKTFKIGICWAGAARHHRDRERSMRLEMWAPWKQVPNVTWISLQKGPPTSDPGRQQFPMIDHTNDLKTFADTAALMENLDLVISVDTSIVHLAGALGKPVWTLCPYLPDWRWLLNRDDSPWYPSMRLMRQSKINDWSDVIDRIGRQLAEVARKK